MTAQSFTWSDEARITSYVLIFQIKPILDDSPLSDPGWRGVKVSPHVYKDHYGLPATHRSPDSSPVDGR